DRESKISRRLLDGQVEDIAFGRPQVRVALIARGPQPQRGQEVVPLDARVVGRGAEGDGFDVDVLDPPRRRQRPELSESPSECNPAPQPPLAVFVKLPGVIVTADRETVRAVEQERLTELDGVTLQLRSGHSLNAKFL